MGGLLWRFCGEKWGSRRGQSDVCTATGSSWAQVFSTAQEIWVLILELTHLSSQLHTQFATTTMSRLEGGEVRGWPFLYTIVLRGSLGCGKSLNFTRQSGFTSMDQVLGYGRECFWGLCTLILALPHVLRFPSCSRTCNTMFLRHKARANIWFWWGTLMHI